VRRAVLIAALLVAAAPAAAQQKPRDPSPAERLALGSFQAPVSLSAENLAQMRGALQAMLDENTRRLADEKATAAWWAAVWQACVVNRCKPPASSPP
jgi:hypothetical protein